MPGLPITQLPAGQQIFKQNEGPGFSNPVEMLANQMDMELGQIGQWFDSQIYALDREQLEPDKHKKEYEKLQKQAADARLQIQAKHEATAQQLKNMQALVQNGTLTQHQYNQAALVMAGIPAEQVREAFEIPKQKNTIQALRDVNTMILAVNRRLKGFEDEGERSYIGGIFREGKAGDRLLYYTDPSTKKRRRIKDEATIAEYDTLAGQREQLLDIQALLIGQSPGFMQRAMLGQATLTGRTISPAQPTAQELIAAAEGKDEATRRRIFEQGVRLGYWR